MKFGEIDKIGSVGNLSDDPISTSASDGQQIDPRIPINQPGSMVKVWPFDGATNVPVSWWGGEIPDPIADYTGDRSAVGSYFDLYAATPLTLHLLDPNGAELPLLAIGGKDAVTGGLSFASGSNDGFMPKFWTGAFAAQRLLPGSHYTLSLDVPEQSTTPVLIHFTTAGKPPVVVGPATTCKLAVTRSANRRTLSFTRSAACTGTIRFQLLRNRH